MSRGGQEATSIPEAEEAPRGLHSLEQQPLFCPLLLPSPSLLHTDSILLGSHVKSLQDGKGVPCLPENKSDR